MAKQKQDACEQKKTLLAAYQLATAGYSLAVTELNRRIGISSIEEFNKLRRKSGEARENAANALKALDDHIADHEC